MKRDTDQLSKWLYFLILFALGMLCFREHGERRYLEGKLDLYASFATDIPNGPPKGDDKW